MGENPHDSGRGHHTHPGLVSALLHRNKGAAFGMHIATPGTMDWGKLLLGLFRIGMVVALIC